MLGPERIVKYSEIANLPVHPAAAALPMLPEHGAGEMFEGKDIAGRPTGKFYGFREKDKRLFGISDMADSLQQNGQLNPITIYKGQLLDGRQRTAGFGVLAKWGPDSYVENGKYVQVSCDPDVRVQEFFGTEAEAVAFVVGEGFHRRHFENQSQRALSAIRLNDQMEEPIPVTSMARVYGVSRNTLQLARRLLVTEAACRQDVESFVLSEDEEEDAQQWRLDALKRGFAYWHNRVKQVEAGEVHLSTIFSTKEPKDPNSKTVSENITKELQRIKDAFGTMEDAMGNIAGLHGDGMHDYNISEALKQVVTMWERMGEGKGIIAKIKRINERSEEGGDLSPEFLAELRARGLVEMDECPFCKSQKEASKFRCRDCYERAEKDPDMDLANCQRILDETGR